MSWKPIRLNLKPKSRERAQKKAKKEFIPEKHIQLVLLQRLQLDPLVAKVWASDSDFQWSRIGTRTNFRKGIPDIQGFFKNGQFFCIEVKSAKGKLTPEQREFLELAKRAGCLADVARSLEDLERLLNAYRNSLPQNPQPL